MLDAVDPAVSLERRDAGADLPMVPGVASGVLGARLAAAQGPALAGQLVAGLVVTAVLVVCAAHILAADVAIALEALGAVAPGVVVVHAALGPVPALGEEAGVHTLVVLAGLVQRAVAVGGTLHWNGKKGQRVS